MSNVYQNYIKARGIGKKCKRGLIDGVSLSEFDIINDNCIFCETRSSASIDLVKNLSKEYYKGETVELMYVEDISAWLNHELQILDGKVTHGREYEVDEEGVALDGKPDWIPVRSDNCIEIDGDRLKVEIAQYVSNPKCMAISLTDADTCEPYSIPTVNLGDKLDNGATIPKNCAFMDTNNSPTIAKYFIESGIAKHYTDGSKPVYKQSGYCMYPLFEFDAEKLKSFDNKGYSMYSTTYDEADKNPTKEQENLFDYQL